MLFSLLYIKAESYTIDDSFIINGFFVHDMRHKFFSAMEKFTKN